MTGKQPGPENTTRVQDKPAEKPERTPSEPRAKAFDEVIKDAKKLEGLFNLYQKDDRLYMEIRPEQFGEMHVFLPTLWTSVGSRSSGTPIEARVFYLEKRDQKVLLVWKNTQYQAHKSAQFKRSLEIVVPDSIGHVFKIESEPHPERQSSLVLLDDFFFSDLADLGARFSRGESIYSLDKTRTLWGNTRAFPMNLELEVRYTMTSPKPRPEPSVPDPKILTARVRYSVSELPMNNGYRPRLADDRVGYFMTSAYDFDKLGLDGTAVNYINRWRLEKKDPGAKVSAPKEPIVFWLENTIPPEFRPAIRDGVLEWNKAFEKAGFKNAVVVKDMPDDADWDAADVRYNTIRWIASLSGEGGGGSSNHDTNPFTGQILDADVIIWAPLRYILAYQAFYSPLSLASSGQTENPFPWGRNFGGEDNFMLGWQRDTTIMAMLAGGVISDIKDVPREFYYEFYKSLACHEVGHTLGLRHNFKGSTTFKLKDLNDRALTTRRSMGNSIMDYFPANLAPKGTKQGEYYPTTIGAWDEWVIEYGYTPLEAANSEDESPALAKIAARSNEPELAYGTDEDADDGGSPFAISIDPVCVKFDLGEDSLTYAEQEVQRTRDVWRQFEKRALFEGKSYYYLRLGFVTSLMDYYFLLNRAVLKWIGGVYHSRTHVGDPGNALPYRVVEPEKQRRALEILKKDILNADALKFSAEFLVKLQADRSINPLHPRPEPYEWFRLASDSVRLNFSLADYLQTLYQRLLRSLYDPVRLHRIQDNESMTRGEKLTLGDYMGELNAAIWRELKDGQSITPYRRILQRECLARVTDLVLKAPPQAPADALSICRYQLKELDKSIQNYLQAQTSVDLETRAHLENCADQISATLKAAQVKNIS